MRDMTYEERQLFYAEFTCPGCRQAASSYMLGPRGGMCVNVQCERCGMQLNVLQPGSPSFMMDGVGQVISEPEGYTPPTPLPLSRAERIRNWWSINVRGRSPLPRRLRWRSI